MEIQRCGMIVSETAIQQTPKDPDVSNFRVYTCRHPMYHSHRILSCALIAFQNVSLFFLNANEFDISCLCLLLNSPFQNLMHTG